MADENRTPFEFTVTVIDPDGTQTSKPASADRTPDVWTTDDLVHVIRTVCGYLEIPADEVFVMNTISAVDGITMQSGCKGEGR